MENQYHTGSNKWLKMLNKTVGMLGHDAFQDNLFNLVNNVVTIDHCTVFVTDADGTMVHIFTKSLLEETACNKLAEAYTQGYYTKDPNLAPLSNNKTNKQKQHITLNMHTPTSSYDKDYQKMFFIESGLVDKASCLLQNADQTIYCSFYRLEQSGLFSDSEFEELSRILPVLTNLIFKHICLLDQNTPMQKTGTIITQVPLSRSTDAISKLLTSNYKVFSQLTQREREVCIRIIKGYSSEAIALELKVAKSTIHTYRKRAYIKLGISSQHELFSLCLEFMSPTVI